MLRAYYNEIDPYAAQWLRNLIAAGHIAAGDVDERSIVDVRADDLRGYVQCHFFAGIGVWSHALRSAGCADDRPVWTGSCPCQPFSAAGKGEGTDDARHLWPEWFRLIREHRPVAIFGEQVSAAIRHGWLDLVSADLEGLDYALGAAVVGAHSVGAPHIRQRLYFVADADARSERLESGSSGQVCSGRTEYDAQSRFRRRGEDGELADAQHAERRAERKEHGDAYGRNGLGRRSDVGELADAGHVQRSARPSRSQQQSEAPIGEQRGGGSSVGELDDTASARRDSQGQGAEGEAWDKTWLRGLECGCGESFWSACDWLPCIDGKARPVEPGTFPLVTGAPSRLGRLRAYGNGLNAEVATAFLRACRGDR